MKKFIIALVLLAGCSAPAPDRCVEAYADLSFNERYECAQRKHFNAWDGQHWQAVDALKARLNDPDSLQVEATKHGLNDDSEDKQYYRVVMKFRAKNGFGGYVTSYAGASCDLKTGRVLDMQID